MITSLTVSNPTEAGNIVTQMELQRFVELRRQESEFKRLKKSIRDRLLLGSRVEDGEWSAAVQTTEARRFSYQRLAELIGDAAASELRDQIRRSTTTTLRVTRREDHRGDDHRGDETSWRIPEWRRHVQGLSQEVMDEITHGLE